MNPVSHPQRGRHAETPLITFVGRSGTGKTTFLERLIPALKRRGLRVGVVKHDAHQFEMDRPGKDSWRFAQAGADAVLISSPEKLALIERPQREQSLDEAISRLPEVDLILTEGYHSDANPKIEIHRKELKRPLLTPEKELLAVCTDEPLSLRVPQFPLNDAESCADFIVNWLREGANPSFLKTCPTILFDLDGTLTDPGIGITNSVAYALKKFGISVTERAELYKFIGPPLRDSFQEYYGFTREKAEQAVSYYREYYHDRGLLENRLYPGMDRLLARLKAQHRKVVLATSKPEVFARQILEHFGILQYFDILAGATLDGSRDTKSSVIAYALEQLGPETSPDALLMVGDREYDVLGAKAFGIQSVGVLFGYGSAEELEQAGAIALAASVEELGKLLGVD